MRLFVTGASGFIGKNFCRKALKKGYTIYAPTRKKKFYYFNKNMIWLSGKFYHNWKTALSNSNLLVHFAASGIKHDDTNDIYDVNVFNSLELLKNSILNDCKNWLIISSSSEFGLKKKKTYFNIKTNRIPDTNYGLSKAIFTDQSIKLAKKYKCKLRIMRLFSIFGSGESKKRLYPSVLNHIKQNKNFYIKNPNAYRNFTNVDFATNTILEAVDFKKKSLKIIKYGMFLIIKFLV